jgi:hypothetical protein
MGAFADAWPCSRLSSSALASYFIVARMFAQRFETLADIAILVSELEFL